MINNPIKLNTSKYSQILSDKYKLKYKRMQQVIWTWMQRINTLLTDYSWKSQTKKAYIKAEPYIYTYIYMTYIYMTYIYRETNPKTVTSLHFKNLCIFFYTFRQCAFISSHRTNLVQYFEIIFWWQLTGSWIETMTSVSNAIQSFSQHIPCVAVYLWWCEKSDNHFLFSRKTNT